MGIILTFALIAVVGFLLSLYFYKYWDNFFETAFLILSLISAIFTIFFGSYCIINKINADINYENMLMQRNAIVYRLEQTKNDNNLLVNGGVYEDVIEYNNTIRKYKRWKHNFWLSWFYPADIDKLEYIELS